MKIGDRMAEDKNQGYQQEGREPSPFSPKIPVIQQVSERDFLHDGGNVQKQCQLRPVIGLFERGKYFRHQKISSRQQQDAPKEKNYPTACSVLLLVFHKDWNVRAVIRKYPFPIVHHVKGI